MGKQWKQCQTLLLWSPKSVQTVTAAIKLKDAYSLEENMTNLDSIFKSRDIILPTKVRLVKAMVFPVVMYGCESRTIKKPENWRIDDFELWCWRRLLRVPWTARRSNLSILKEISPEYSLEGLKLKLKLQTLVTWCEELTHWKRPWCWKRMRAEWEGGDRGWDSWMTSLTQWTWVWVDFRREWRTGKPGMLQYIGSQRVGHGWAPEQQQVLKNRQTEMNHTLKGINSRRTDKWPEAQNGGNHCHRTEYRIKNEKKWRQL